MTHKSKFLISNLKNDWILFEQSLETLRLSIIKCDKILTKSEFTFEELESIDSLTSKFSRTTDIYIQKVIRGIWGFLREPYVPFLDMVNKAEKMDIITTAESVLQIRELRNAITHEYLPDLTKDMAKDVIDMWDDFLESISKTQSFLLKYKILD